ncbi:MAG: hypothetical protein P4L46_00440 [Fimbriimonas sp.]|nr:hypothetical protein [Fimbriimonas sp.]
MIRCPRCGADAQWGASQCPRCQAPFVAPPGPPVTARRNSGRPIFVASLIGLLAIALMLWLGHRGLSRPKEAITTLATSQSPSMPSSGSMAASGTSEPPAGIFQVTGQAQQDPVVAIKNDTVSPLRLMLQCADGSVQAEWIQAGTSKDLTILQGRYLASIDAPDNENIMPTNGTIDVKNFHHYEADFIAVPYADTDSSFYIGD